MRIFINTAPMNPVVHFEMPFEDRDRMSTFYENAFGWKMQKMGEEMGNYVVASTTETGPSGQSTRPGAINGGFFPKSADNPNPSVVIGVEDIHTAIKKVVECGGTIMPGPMQNSEPVDIPGVGLYAGFTDPEGNRVSLLQPKGM